MNKSTASMFNLPNLITGANMLCGVFSILLSLSGRIDLAPYPIFLGAILDFLDGFAARMLKIQSEMGKQLDSLADMITFGLAPGIMMLGVLVYTTGNGGGLSSYTYYFSDLNIIDWFKNIYSWNKPNLIPFIAFLIPIFSMFRLAKFNLDTRQSESFIGVPTPANTIFFCMFPLVLGQEYELGTLNNLLILIFCNSYILIPIIIVMSILLVSEIPLFSLKFKHFKWEGNQLRYVFLITCSLLIVTTCFWSLGLIVILYLMLSVIDIIFKKEA